jgi:hypothetical protein
MGMILVIVETEEDHVCRLLRGCRNVPDGHELFLFFAFSHCEHICPIVKIMTPHPDPPLQESTEFSNGDRI